MTKAEIIAETRNAVEKVLKGRVKNAFGERVSGDTMLLISGKRVHMWQDKPGGKISFQIEGQPMHIRGYTDYHEAKRAAAKAIADGTY